MRRNQPADSVGAARHAPGVLRGAVTAVRRMPGFGGCENGGGSAIVHRMPTTSAWPPHDSQGGWPAFLRRLSGRAIVVALMLGALAAVVLNHFFMSPFVVLLGRMLFLSMVLLLAFTAAGHWRQHWLPRWLMQLLAVVVAAPLATLVGYLLSTGGDAAAFFGSTPRLLGFAWITATGTVLGLLFALGALYRERDAQLRAQQLQFELERQRLERQASDARLSLLRSQIAPHFLFNTLANVQALVEAGSSRAPAVLGSLIAYLRAAMPRLQDQQATLGDEAALVRAYLELMHMRMPDRLEFNLQIPDAALALRFPPMALLTLVENAVRHGVDPSEQGGRIDVGAEFDAQGRTLRLWVQDSGVGMTETARPGTGLNNLRERLAAFYGPAGTLQLDEVEPHGLRAQLQVPAEPGSA